MLFRTLFGLVGLGLFLNLNFIQAQLINVNFTQNSDAGQGGPSPGPTMSGSAVLGGSRDVWNGISGSTGSGIPLAFANGAMSPVTLGFTSGGGYNVYNFGGTTPFAATPWNALMQTYLYNNGVPQSLNLYGLKPNSLYHLAVYNAANSSATSRTTYFSVNSITHGSTWNGTNSVLESGVDYSEFPAVFSDGSGHLAISYTGNGTEEGDINGFQIQPSSLQTTVICSGTNVVISFAGFAGYSYQVKFKSNLTDTAWVPLGKPLPGNNSTLVVTDPISLNGRFYQIQMIEVHPALPFLRASGTNIVSAEGVPVKLHGLNLGGWLVMEPWMCPADSGGLPDTYSIIGKLDSRFGVPTEQALIRQYQTCWITTNDLDNITNGGFNLVRVPVWWGNFYSITNTASSGWRLDAFAELDWLMANCAERGIYVIIDMHGVVGGQSVSDDTGRENDNSYWTNAVEQAQTEFMWQAIASHFQTNSVVAAYDLINEPDNAPGTQAVWSSYDSLYHTVRSADTNHIVIMEGAFGSWNWNMLPSPSVYGWTNIVYSMHEYQFGGTTNQVETGSDNQVLDFDNHLSWNIPGYIGEWNDMGNGAGCYDYSINDYNKAGFMWTMWAYKAAAGLNPNGWAWYDPTFWPTTPNVSTDSVETISNDWQEWKTSNSFQLNPAVGL